MAPIHVLDNYYLLVTLLVTVAYQLSGFAIAWILQFDKITDFTGGSNFFILAILTLCLGNTYHTRQIVATVIVLCWATRIAGFLLFRVLKTGSDTRFDDIRSHFLKFLGFWVGQIVWVWTVSLPITILNSPNVVGRTDPAFGTGRDVAGLVLALLGLLIETVADAQKFRYKQSHPPKGQPTTVGIWRYSRHPPYFGEIIFWWGIWTLSLSPTTNGSLPGGSKAAQYGAVASPLFTTLLLLFASGIPTAEKPTAQRFYLLSHGRAGGDPGAWERYKAYLRETSVLVPLPRWLYRPLPVALKRTLLLDFPFYQFDERTDGPHAIEEQTPNP